MTENKASAFSEVSPMMHQIGMLNLRITDMMTQLNAVVKMMVDENAALKKENNGLKTTLEQKQK